MRKIFGKKIPSGHITHTKCPKTELVSRKNNLFGEEKRKDICLKFNTEFDEHTIITKYCDSFGWLLTLSQALTFAPR